MEFLTTRELFGGAITAETRPDLVDAATLRQVPDTQEVFMYPDSSISIVVEILQRVERMQFGGAVEFHFESLAHDNDAKSADIENVTVIPNDRGDDTPSAIILSGVQEVSKFNRPTPDKVQIYMALFRVEDKQIDLVVTFNVPITSEDGGAVGQEGLDLAQKHFDAFARSLRIIDYGLFA